MVVPTGSLNSESTSASEPVNREEGEVSAVVALVEHSIPEFGNSEGISIRRCIRRFWALALETSALAVLVLVGAESNGRFVG
jgi:hypothetical protein